MKEAQVRGWPALVFMLLIALGLVDVVERMVAAL